MNQLLVELPDFPNTSEAKCRQFAFDLLDADIAVPYFIAQLGFQSAQKMAVTWNDTPVWEAGYSDDDPVYFSFVRLGLMP